MFVAKFLADRENMKVNGLIALAFVLALINVGCKQVEKANPIEVKSDEGKATGSLQIRGNVIDLKYAYTIKTTNGFIILLTDETVPKTSLQSFDPSLLKDIWGVFLHLDSSGKKGLYEMRYGSGFKGGGTEELEVLDCKFENGRVIGEVKYPKAGDKSDKSFSITFDAPLKN